MIDGHVNILSVPVFGGNFDQVLNILWLRLQSTSSGRPEPMAIVYTPTTEHMVMAQTDPSLRQAFSLATLNCADAIGIVWADFIVSRRKKRAWVIRQRVPGIDLASALALKTLKAGKKVFLLGGASGVAQKAANRFSTINALGKTLIMGERGSNDIAHETEIERTTVLKRIAEFKPDLVLVGYGAPWQELWLQHNRNALQSAGVKVAMVVGGSLDVWAGKIPRASMYLRKIGLEWLWRLMHEPWRWRRQLRLLQFVRLVLR